jgi:hypothetical protein
MFILDFWNSALRALSLSPHGAMFTTLPHCSRAKRRLWTLTVVLLYLVRFWSINDKFCVTATANTGWNICWITGLEVLTTVVVKVSILWDTTPCIPLKAQRCFGGTSFLHLQGRRINHARNQSEASSKQGHSRVHESLPLVATSYGHLHCDGLLKYY